jgi:hypothetical protein
MKTRETDAVNYLGTILCIAVCFICLFAFSDSSVNHSYYPVQHEVSFESQSSQANAILLDEIHLPSSRKSYLSICHNIYNELYDVNFKIAGDNRKIIQSIIRLQKAQLSIRPEIIHRFYIHPVLTDTKEPPVLS